MIVNGAHVVFASPYSAFLDLFKRYQKRSLCSNSTHGFANIDVVSVESLQFPDIGDLERGSLHWGYISYICASCTLLASILIDFPVLCTWERNSLSLN